MMIIIDDANKYNEFISWASQFGLSYIEFSHLNEDTVKRAMYDLCNRRY